MSLQRGFQDRYATGWERPRAVALACLLFWIAVVLDLLVALRVYGALPQDFAMRQQFLGWIVLRTPLWAGLIYLIWRGQGPMRLAWLAVTVVGIGLLYGSQWAMFRSTELLGLVSPVLKLLGFLLVFLPPANAWFRIMRRWSPS